MVASRASLGLVVLGWSVGSQACAGAPPPAAAPAPVAVPDSVLGSAEGTAPLEVDASAGDASPEAGPPGAPGASITVLAKNLHASAALAVDPNAIYWVDEAGGEVTRAPKRGGLTMTLYGGSGVAFSRGSSIAVDGGDVYFIADIEQGAVRKSALQRLDKNGGRPTPIASSASARILGLALDDANVYWVIAGAVVRGTKDGAAPTVVASGLTGADAVAVDGSDVYVTLAGTEAKQFADGSVVAAPKKGGAPRVLVPSSPRAANVLIDAKNVYWQSAAGVMKVPKAGGPPTVLAPATVPVDDLALDAAYVYFATHGGPADGTVARVAKEGGAIETLATGQHQPAGIAVDEAAVYWSCLGTEDKKFSDGTISKRDKP